MKNLNKVITVSLVALTILIGSVGSVAAGSKRVGYDFCAMCSGKKASKRLYSWSKSNSAPSHNVRKFSRKNQGRPVLDSDWNEGIEIVSNTGKMEVPRRKALRKVFRRKNTLPEYKVGRNALPIFAPPIDPATIKKTPGNSSLPSSKVKFAPMRPAEFIVLKIG